MRPEALDEKPRDDPPRAGFLVAPMIITSAAPVSEQPAPPLPPALLRPECAPGVANPILRRAQKQPLEALVHEGHLLLPSGPFVAQEDVELERPRVWTS